MSDDATTDLSDVIDAAINAEGEAEQAHAALDRGIDPGELEEAMSLLGSTARELQHQAEAVSEVADMLNSRGGVMELEAGADDAYDHITEVRNFLTFVQRSLEELDTEDDDDGATTTIMVDGRSYEVTVAATDDKPEPGYTFGEWLANRMEETSLDISDVADMSLADYRDVLDILRGGRVDTNGESEKAKSILSGLHERGFITAEARIDVLEDFGWTGSDLDELTDDEDDESLGELFG